MVVERYLFHVEACPDIDEHTVGIGELAFDVEGVGERDEDGFLFCGWALVWMLDQQEDLIKHKHKEHALSNDDEPDLTTRRHSLNLAWAAASWAYEFERCSTSPSSCFLTAVSCWALRVPRSTRVC